MDTFVNAYDEKIRPLMDKIDQARTILSSSNDGIIFPNVVVVGDQSSGKSTLLEALSLVELPKGSGIVTRCPLVLRLRKANERRVYHLHSDNRKVQLDESKLNILDYIEAETKKLAGVHKNVVQDLIELQVEDPNVRDLTVVDLPGIARNPIADQPQDIHKQTTNLIRQFIRQEGSVILCVFPANVDIATVESFTLAREFDSEGSRTIGVITKSDLAPDNTVLAQQLLMEKPDVFQLKLGFIAVRNRSTDERISLEDARKREGEFFREHSILTRVGSYCLGVDALINRLADLYSDRVREIFPKMKNDIQKKLKETREQLEKLPPSLETASARLTKYYELAEFYIEKILKQRFTISNDGRHSVSLVNHLHTKLKQFENVIFRQSHEFFTEEYHVKVQNAMSACFGEQLPNFLPHPVLKRLIGEKLDQLWSVANLLINECFKKTMNILSENDCEECHDDILLSKLLPIFRRIAISYLNDKKQTVNDQLKELIRLEKHDPYTLNNYYMETIIKFKKYLAEKRTENTTEKKRPSSTKDHDDIRMFDSISNDDQAVQDMLISIYAYWKLLVKRFIDYAALSLRAGCVFDVCSGIGDCLRQLPIKQNDFVDTHLTEDTFIRNKRKQLQQTKERLEKVYAILGGDSITVDDNDTLTNMEPMGCDTTMTLDELSESLSRACKHKTINSSTVTVNNLVTELSWLQPQTVPTNSIHITTAGSVDRR
ncbi:unnamed protein product [Rotaria sordida]|uniref:Dynamin-type G domain-containing protein n=1 Tax=Rotaria sordida TaxID=392033 RepID=A0A819E4W0_9BILA|nr:unnamed protein product [Rotaria sordida]CAF0967038.1 unnamed protein product [Rotaria sordida]CAF0995356.1 unnamed protein product [Rotaria sordida]CAF3710840.1 unnamed protein product [Rotaria sordida]CAF3844318.1 unnamed protein product [Rotaria sordida]